MMSNGSMATPFGASLGGALGKRWWLFALRGVAGIVFGFSALLWPGIALLTLALLWGAYALTDGVFALAAAISGMGSGATPRLWLAVVGIAGIAAGLMTFIWPGITVQAALLLIAVWAIVTGVMEVAGALALRKEIEGELFLILAGLLSIGFGAAILLWPAAGAIGLVWMIAWFAVLGGGAYLALALRLKKLAG